jgi:hypothetical protein
MQVKNPERSYFKCNYIFVFWVYLDNKENKTA